MLATPTTKQRHILKVKVSGVPYAKRLGKPT
jgi:hypothetical protein